MRITACLYFLLFVVACKAPIEKGGAEDMATANKISKPSIISAPSYDTAYVISDTHPR